MRIPRILAVLIFVLPWVASLAAVGWLVERRYPISGSFTADSAMDGRSAWVNPFLPSERVTPPGRQDGWTGQRLMDDPTYFTARVPGPYKTLELTMEYRPINQPMLEFGLVRDAAGKDLELNPLFDSQLFEGGWKKVAYGKTQGYVRSNVSPSRLADPDPRGLAVWDATATMPLLSDPASQVIETETSLRGSHDFYFVPSGGELRVKISIQAANRNDGADLAVFRVFRGEEEISREAYGASGSMEKKMGKTTERSIVIPNAAPGVYRISFVADDDVFIRSIKTTSRRWVIGPRLYFGDTVGYSTTTYPGRALTNSRHIVAETFHAEGVQTVYLANVSIKVTKTHVPTRLDRKDDLAGAAEMKAPKGDIRIIGDGYFALRDDAYFEPKPRRLTDGTDLNKEKMEAVITSYAPPEKLDNGWYRSTYAFELNPSLDVLRFVMSAPGLASRAGGVDVRRISLTYRRPATNFEDWLAALRQELANAWRRL